jgi:S-formylglutathione hydrolase FrmB
MKNKIVFFLFLTVFSLSLQAADVATVFVHSFSMKTDLPVLTIIPEKATKSHPCPVIYLLHGFGGNCTSWYQLKPELTAIADSIGVIFICPDGKKSWYWDSPKDSASRFETYVSSELITYVDAHFPTIPNRTARAITGLSMGGHGAFWLAFRHKDVFGAAGSTSGGVDIRPFPNNWEIKKQLGEESENQALWDSCTVMNQTDKIQNGDLALIFDCGYDDFFFNVNNALHDKLLQRKIDHDFLVRPGAHNATYWNNSIDYQILFFRKYFQK